MDADRRGPAEDPGTVGEGVDGFDLAVLGYPSERLGRDLKECGRPGQVEPWLDAVGGRAVDRDSMMGSQRRHPLPGPAIAVAGNQPVAVQQPRDEIVAGDADQQFRGWHR